MSKAPEHPYHNTAAVLTTMHGKEKVISPVLEDSLGLVVSLATGVNTDCFGTFSREIERTGSQLDAARAKNSAGFNVTPWARVGLASDGSFGPHPSIPFVALGRELIVLVDRDRGLELTGYDASLSTNYGHKNVSTVDEAISFALIAGLPDHGVIVMGCNAGKPALPWLEYQYPNNEIRSIPRAGCPFGICQKLRLNRYPLCLPECFLLSINDLERISQGLKFTLNHY